MNQDGKWAPPTDLNLGWGLTAPHFTEANSVGSRTFTIQFDAPVPSFPDFTFGPPIVSTNSSEFCKITLSGPAANGSSVPTGSATSFTVDYNCSLAAGFTEITMSLPVVVTYLGTTFASPQWRWIKATSPFLPDVPQTIATSANEEVRGEITPHLLSPCCTLS